jgi:ATPases of the AAA+ class
LEKLGITRKKVVMLEGPPGTGKSSLIMSLASKLEKDIAYFSFTPDITDTKLIKSMQNTPEDAIIVFEDIDCLFEERKVNDTSKNSITFSALLNCLDGLVCKDGLIVIATTNHID